MSRDKPRKPSPEAARSPSSPFAALEGLREKLPPGAAEPLVVPMEKEARGPARAVIRRERKGHGGKEVTWVEKLELDAATLERWCKELKQALGVGGAIVEGALMFQGDQRERLRTMLEARGVRKLSVS